MAIECIIVYSFVFFAWQLTVVGIAECSAPVVGQSGSPSHVCHRRSSNREREATDDSMHYSTHVCKCCAHPYAAACSAPLCG